MWYYNGQEFDGELAAGLYGFVYLITNLQTGKMYIGRKFFTKAHSRTVKGKKKKSRVPSDWENYWGSSEELLKDIAALGKENFRRDIIRLCLTLGECKYQETKLQFQYNVLEAKLGNGELAYYNSNIAMKYTRRNIGKGSEPCLIQLRTDLAKDAERLAPVSEKQDVRTGARSDDKATSTQAPDS
jgi:hypothetical protein